MASFIEAVNLGVDVIEFDVLTTSDGVVICHHDPLIEDTGEWIMMHRLCRHSSGLDVFFLVFYCCCTRHQVGDILDFCRPTTYCSAVVVADSCRLAWGSPTNPMCGQHVHNEFSIAWKREPSVEHLISKYISYVFMLVCMTVCTP